MKLKIILTLIVFTITPSLSAMEKQSWFAHMWKSAKNKLMSIPLIKQELAARKQYQELRKEVEDILISGSTVQEVETKNYVYNMRKFCRNLKEKQKYRIQIGKNFKRHL